MAHSSAEVRSCLRGRHSSLFLFSFFSSLCSILCPLCTCGITERKLQKWVKLFELLQKTWKIRKLRNVDNSFLRLFFLNTALFSYWKNNFSIKFCYFVEWLNLIISKKSKILRHVVFACFFFLLLKGKLQVFRWVVWFVIWRKTSSESLEALELHMYVNMPSMWLSTHFFFMARNLTQMSHLSL